MRVLILLTGILTAALFQNCSKSPFQVNPAEKVATLETRTVFAKSTGLRLADRPMAQDQITELRRGRGMMTELGTIDTEIPTGPGAIALKKPVRYFCSDNATKYLGGNVKSTDPLQLAFLDANYNSVCTFADPMLRPGIVDLQVLQIRNLRTYCPTLAPGTYSLALTKVGATPQDHKEFRDMMTDKAGFSDGLTNAQNAQDILKPGLTDRDKVTVSIGEAGEPVVTPANDKEWWVLYNGNGDSAECEKNESPLIIQMADGRGRAEKIDLTPLTKGIKYDIRGENAKPVAHTKEQISWLSKYSGKNHYFVALPNAQGNIEGANELFGNNTRGPDGKFSADGYLALGKYDGRRRDGTIDPAKHDGFITADDSIFAELRLWQDRNLNGIAESAEIYKLDDFGIEAIDLNYDKNYAEMDPYGNITKMKSVVKTKDGGIHLIFDLWFRL